MRIILLIDSLGPGGAERVMATIANRWAQAGHSITLATFFEPTADFYELDPSVARIGLGLTGPARSTLDAMALNFRRVRRIRRLLRTGHTDVAVSFIDRMNVLTLGASVGLKIPVVVSERVDPRAHQPSAVIRLLRGLLYRRARFIVVQTTSVGTWAERRFGPRRVRVIPNPIAPGFTARAPGWHDQFRSFLGVGRLNRQKGFDILISAFGAVAEDLPDWSLTIYGEGPERSALKGAAEELGVSDRVSLPGVSKNMQDVFDHAGVFVLSSRYEGFPNALLEAMAVGLPSISFACPTGPEDIIEQGQNGLLVTPADAQALGSAMVRLARDADLRHRIAHAATLVVNRFSAEVVGKAWDDLLPSD